MLAPRRPNPPVRVLDHQGTSWVQLTTSDKDNVKGRSSLGVTGRHQREWPRRMLKESTNSTKEVPEQERSSPTPAMWLAVQVANASSTTYTVAVQVTALATSKPDGGAERDVKSLPGQNQNKPTLDDARLEDTVLPGANQDISDMSEIPKQVPPGAAPSSLRLPGAPAITVDKPLPGQNQEDPIMGEVAPPPAPTLPASTSSLLPTTPRLVPTVAGQGPAGVSPATSLPSSIQDISKPIPQFTSMAPIQPLETVNSNSLTLGSATSFVTVTRSEEAKLEATVTAAPSGVSSTAVIAISSVSAVTADHAATQAIAAAQSASATMASTAAVSVGTAKPATLPNNTNGSILHPTARTLLILFVILGILSIIVAIVISIMVKSHKRRSRASKNDANHQVPYDASYDRTGVTTYISADPNDNPFLTASERAIIKRAASPHGDTDTNDLSGFTNAISLFINKSRRLTYKISP
ncbi:hypothetical protein SVAN01_09829 [Stagonosporopsis vannaccii]|nr:hypothetical protein SVAN01_09829 [Stagonosporopsis vannaccii]